MRRAVHRLWLTLFLAVFATSAVFFVVSGLQAAGSVWYGGGIAAASLFILGRCARREADSPANSAPHTLAAGYRCAFQRLLVVAVLFALGMGLWELAPLALLSGFIAGQTTILFPGTRAYLTN